MSLRAWAKPVAFAALWIVIGIACFVIAQYAAALLFHLARLVGIHWDASSPSTLLVYRVVIYLLTLLLLAGCFWVQVRKRLTLADLAFNRLPLWKDIGWAIVGAAGYVALTVLVLNVAGHFFQVNVGQTQDLGFSGAYGGQLYLAFIVLVVLTPLCEELIFRGFLYSRFKAAGLVWWVNAIIVSVLFGLAHGQWNVGLDVFCLSIVACMLRERTGSIWAGTVLHMMKNMLAFYVMFMAINPAGL